ncbi:uncharacterized protein M421DRAFT_417512 [Didymella exigua CBS 183.55]|uniref:Uncharacterized protein n=1 Tax=Didymella exigua CBS 183.55 TaxID=1150837 RepID=A0A6A5RW20_9PLEO|nr:uncharacterized protein M421DRAFT_417512 [Didymella exigua CBS 183.55]KAF1931753.1 hypothetical protein M421DRAFT_417512 [Didymella exigua CBS 183.55]
MTLEEALAECDTCEDAEDTSWTEIAKTHRVVRSTLTRRYQRETRSREEQAITQQKLTPQQEEKLVKYIEELTAHHVPPTREVISNFASAVA